MARGAIRSAGIGLTDGDVATLRAALASNRRPRVAVRGTQFGDAARGQVIAVGDAAANGGEFISVRVRLGGVSDTLTFSPDELSLPGSGARRRAAEVSAGSRRQPTAAGTEANLAAPPAPPPERPAKATPAGREPLLKSASAQKSGIGASDERTMPRGVPTRRAPSSITLTVSSTGHSWTFAATRGGRPLVKVRAVPAAIVSAVAELLSDAALPSDAALLDAVVDINELALAEAQQRAELLRTELAVVESFLESHLPSGRGSAGARARR